MNAVAMPKDEQIVITTGADAVCSSERHLPEETLSFGVDDYCLCLHCDFVGLVTLGADECPQCGECGSLIDQKA